MLAASDAAGWRFCALCVLKAHQPSAEASGERYIFLLKVRGSTCYRGWMGSCPAILQMPRLKVRMAHTTVRMVLPLDGADAQRMSVDKSRESPVGREVYRSRRGQSSRVLAGE